MESLAYTLDFEKPLLDLSRKIEALREQSLDGGLDLKREIRALERKLSALQGQIYGGLTPWQRVQIARHPRRPHALDYVGALFTGFEELHGDRQYGDDRALIGGTAFLGKRGVMLIAQQKGRETKEKIARNFGMPQPEGYRKALRLMKLAEKFGLPVISFVDTPGAYPGIESEARHVSEAIAANLRAMSLLRVPTISIIVGEGGSGGALGIALTDRVLCFENSYYSVISPDGCAAILWKDALAAPQAAQALKLDAKTLLDFGVVDEVLQEPQGGAHNDLTTATSTLGSALVRHLTTLEGVEPEALVEARYERYRQLGLFTGGD